MKNTTLLVALATLLSLGLVSCSNPLGEMEKTPDLATKVVVSTKYAYSEVPGSGNQVFAAEIRQYNDGTAEVIRSTTPYNPSMELTNIFADAVGMQHHSSGQSFSLPPGGWYVPFDPSAQAIAVGGGGTIELHCYCDANGQCLIFGHENQDGTYQLGCASKNCTGNCDGTVVIQTNNNRLVVGNGMFIAASSVQVF